MKILTLLAFISFGVLSCSSTQPSFNNEHPVGIKQKTSNPNTPYIYKNGFKDYEVKPILTLQDNDSIYVNELRFNAVFSALYTKKLMYDKYGKWDQEVWLQGATRPILVWENRKLLESEDQLYSVATNGTESKAEMFASVIVFDLKNNDCMSDNYQQRDALIHFFASEIWNLNPSEAFYDVYWDMVIAHNGSR
ncbi:hypothetical protein [Formosa haliotis]|uniref:hypothetical protein n=1 Tax=Formosa haliotis TaxID=1555194 RepID=UPI00082492FE|nr:hypothetical protein [Formosa haliotis]